MAGKALFITSNTGIEHDELIKPVNGNLKLTPFTLKTAK